jgi:2-desacetyl-2-hydroxyethyl bacteriochlorophyllide A dehydrogenase
MDAVVQFTGERAVEVADVEPDPLPPGHVRVRTRYSGISAGTELTAYRGTNPYLNRVWDPATRLFTPGDGLRYPVAGWGYSEVGQVVEASAVPDGDRHPRVGEWVWGIWGHRSGAVVAADKLTGHQLPAGVEPLAASFARVGAVALNAVLAAGLHLGETVAIFGQGVIGLLATRLATLSGAAVIAVDGIPARREAALAFGAVAALAPQRAAEEIRTNTSDLGADVAIELSGAYPALHEAIRSVTAGGQVVAAGFYQGDGAGLRLGEEFHHNRVSVVASQIGGVPAALGLRWSQDRLQRTFLAQLAAGTVTVDRLVSHVLPVQRAAEAYELLDRHPADALQVVLEFPEA